jgi:hypothetical protein
MSHLESNYENLGQNLEAALRWLIAQYQPSVELLDLLRQNFVKMKISENIKSHKLYLMYTLNFSLKNILTHFGLSKNTKSLHSGNIM